MIPYCGAPPVPGELLLRWNLDPALLASLALAAGLHLRVLQGRVRSVVGAGWAIATLAFITPICALSVALFSARIGQHMILMLVAAPLIAVGIPRGRWRHSVWWSVIACTAALWVWHMPVPYDATFHSDAIYWSMHLTLFGSAIWLWRDLLNDRPDDALITVGAGLFVCVQMGLLGAVLALTNHPWFAAYATTTQAWGLAPLQDQQLGGILMWVPGTLIFLIAALRTLHLVHRYLDGPATA